MLNADNNIVLGNYIGTDAGGTLDRGNTLDGVFTDGATSATVVGGTVAGARNVISGNGDDGVHLSGSATEAAAVQGNYIGTNAAGSAALGNGDDGVAVDSSNNTIGGANGSPGGSCTGSCNLISGNGGDGVHVTNATANNLYGNYIGTDVAGSADLGNAFNGVFTDGSATSTDIGGATASSRNVISGNNADGIVLSGAASEGANVHGNFIGMRATGSTALPNANIGIRSDTSDHNVGDANGTPGADCTEGCNLISGNNTGIQLTAGTGVVIQGNYIGTDVTGVVDRGNLIDGISTTGTSSGTIIGGTTAATRNVISGNNDDGIHLSGAASEAATVQGNYIGLISAGTTILPNGVHGVLTDTSFHTIGGANASPGGACTGACNVISGNGASGIFTTSPSGLLIRGNFIGTDVGGTVDRGNGIDGIATAGTAAAVLIGGTTPSGGNVVSGNTDDGIEVNSAPGTLVQGNFVGTNAAGSGALGNGGEGVEVLSTGTAEIGGTAAGTRNIISGNTGDGVEIVPGAGTGSVIHGNYIGTNAAGSAAVGNGGQGVLIGGNTNTVGGTAAGDRNVISGNTNGIGVNNATGVTIQGNFIGTDATGMLALGNNALDGIVTFGTASGTIIGGTSSSARNVISGNRHGIFLSGAPSEAATVQGNYIGVAQDGSATLGNTGNGILIETSANVIGGTAAGAGNTIAHNGTGVPLRDGILITSVSATGNVIRGNSIHSNGSLGIELGNDGPQVPQDNLDPDNGPNNLQNYPVLQFAIKKGITTLVEGTLNSTASTTFNLDFYAQTACDAAPPNDYGEGGRYLGSTTVTTLSNGNINFAANVGITLLGEFVTATATRNAAPLDSSEFSKCLVVQGMQVDETANTNLTLCSLASLTPDCTLRGAINNANTDPALDSIDFGIGSELCTGVCTIAVGAGGLPTITAPVIVDGYTQSGAIANTNATNQGSNALLTIQLSGGGAGAGVHGLHITGGDSTVRGLVINTFAGSGIRIETGDNNVIAGNVIGTDAAGAVDLGNGADGVEILTGSGNNCIGGTFVSSVCTGAPAHRNVLSGNGDDGVAIGSAPTPNFVKGNIIGLTASGANDLGNTGEGVAISAANNVVGGTTTTDRNVISGNDQNGIVVTLANLVQGNYIGTDVGGTLDRGNNVFGVATGGTATGATVGGTTAGARNVISGNNNDGVNLSGAATEGSLVQGNFIGTTASGTGALGNSGDGVSTDTSNNTIGGLNGSNTIANNAGGGVYIVAGTGNQVRYNSIHSNVGLGVDLDPNGVTANDPDDPDPGANNLQNFPVITQAVKKGSFTQVTATLNSTPSTTFGVETYTSSACNAAPPNDYGEAETQRHSTLITTDGNGDASFSPLLGATQLGQFVTMQAIQNASLDSSEFSQCVAVGPMVVDTTSDANLAACNSLVPADCSLRGAINNANTDAARDSIVFNIPGAGPHTINVNSSFPATGPLPTITQPVTIDGYTQPGAVANTNATNQGSNAVLRIELNGAVSSAGVSGLTVTGNDSVIRGLVINRFPANGIVLDTGDNNAIAGNFVGTNTSGVSGVGNGLDAVVIQNNSGNNCVGGTIVASICAATPADRNIISGNSDDGVAIGSAPTPNFVKGNIIGLTADGTSFAANSSDGIAISAAGNVIGGTTAPDRNIISGNTQNGILVAAGSTIQGNYIGTGPSGATAGSNGGNGIATGGTATGAIIGGTTAGARNVISANIGHGVSLSGAATESAIVRGNFIGTNAAGTGSLANAGDGVSMNTSGNSIGGTAAGAGNIIAFNGDGVEVTAGTDNNIRRNTIHSNRELGIDLGTNGVTNNDLESPPDTDVGANNLQNFPEITNINFDLFAGTDVSGTLYSTPNTQFTIELFHGVGCDFTLHGEGDNYLGSVTVTTNASGSVSFTQNFSDPSVGLSIFLAATATDPSGNTSEFSACKAVSDDTNDDNDMLLDSVEVACGSNPLNPFSLPERMDTGSDDDGDNLFNEVLPTPGSVSDCDGDGFTGRNEAGTPLCASAGNDDSFDDAVANDGCPGGPAQVGAFSEAQFKIGTIEQDPCGNNGWPLELVSTVPSVNEFDIVDLGSFVAPIRRMGKNPNQAGFSSRWDFSPGPGALPGSGWINIIDLAASISATTGFPPMLNTVKALNQVCPFPP